MRRFIPKVSRQFPQEFYSEDFFQLKQQQQSGQKNPITFKIHIEDNIEGLPQLQFNTLKNDCELENTANFISPPIIRYSQSQECQYKQSRIEKKKQMEFTFCQVEKMCNKNTHQLHQRILPLLKYQNAKTHDDYNLLSTYQNDQHVRKRLSSHQSNSKNNQNDQDQISIKTNQLKDEQIRVEEFQLEQNMNIKHDQKQSIPIQYSTNQNKSLPRNITNSDNKKSTNPNQYKFSCSPKPTNNKIKQEINTIFSNHSLIQDIENINPNIQLQFKNQNNISNMRRDYAKNNQEDKINQYYASPISDSLSKDNNSLFFQSNIQKFTNPMRQSYQNLNQDGSKINQQTLRNFSQLQSHKKEINIDIEEDYYNSQKSQIKQEFSNSSKSDQNKCQAKQNLKKQNVQNIFARIQPNTNVNQIEQQDKKIANLNFVEINEDQNITNNNNKNNYLPALKIFERNKNKKSIDYGIFNNQNLNRITDIQIYQDIFSPKTISKECLANESKVSSFQNRINSPSPQITQSDKQRVQLQKQPSQSNRSPNFSLNSQKQIVSPKKLISLNISNKGNNQLDKLHDPEWFYSQLGRPNLLSYQEKRQKGNQYAHRNIQSSQQQLKEDQRNQYYIKSDKKNKDNQIESGLLSEQQNKENIHIQ